MKDSKEIIFALKKARIKCADTVDNSTLRELDSVINALESKGVGDSKSAYLKWLSFAAVLLKLLSGLSDE